MQGLGDTEAADHDSTSVNLVDSPGPAAALSQEVCRIQIYLRLTKRSTDALVQIGLDPDMAEMMERLQSHLKSLKDNANEAKALSEAIVDARATMDDVLRSKLPSSEYDHLTVL